MHALTPSWNSIFLGQVLCSREISGTSSIRNVAQPNLYTKLSMVFLHLYLLSLPCFLKHLSHYCTNIGRGPLKLWSLWIGRVFFLEFFFFLGKCSTCPSLNATLQMQLKTSMFKFSRRVGGLFYCHLLLKNLRNHPIESSQPKADLGVLGVGWQHHGCKPVERISWVI